MPDLDIHIPIYKLIYQSLEDTCFCLCKKTHTIERLNNVGLLVYMNFSKAIDFSDLSVFLAMLE